VWASSVVSVRMLPVAWGVCPRLPFVAHASAASLPSLPFSPPSETMPSSCACPLTCSHEIVVPLSATHLHASRRTVMMATFGDSHSNQVYSR
jgi:hypothetical protein